MRAVDAARHRILGDDHARGCVLLLRVRAGLEDDAAERLLRDTLDDSRDATNLFIDADSLLAMDNHVRKVRPYPRSLIGSVLIDISERSRYYALPDHVISRPIRYCYRLHGHRWRRYWRNNFVVRLIPDNERAGDNDDDGEARRSSDRFDANEDLDRWRIEEIDEFA